MSAPAVDDLVVSTIQCVSKVKPTWSPNPPSSIPFTAVTAVQGLRCPAVVTTQPRADGSRPMLPWWKSWVRGSIPVRRISTQLPYGWYVADGSDSHPMLSWYDPWAAQKERLTPALNREWYVDQVAKTKTLGKLNEQKMQLGVTALELKQTVGLLTDLSTSLLGAMVSIVNGRQKVARETDNLLRWMAKGGHWEDGAQRLVRPSVRKEVLEHARDSWMAYQFGLKPLVGDVHNAFDALYTSVFEKGAPIIYRVGSGYQSDFQEQATLLAAESVRESVVYTGVFSISSAVHYSVVYEQPAGEVPTARLLGLDNSFAIGWEVTKLSWMFDYAIGMGDWMNSFTATQGLRFLEGCKSTLKRSVLDRILVEQGTLGKFVDKPHWNAVGCEYGSFERTLVGPSGLVPGVVPQLKRKIGLIQLANSVFACTSWLGGKPALR